jgi:thiol-disulfide isomerase/thioredoxin
MSVVSKREMSTAAPPLLIFFTSTRNGHCRRAEGYLAQVLQRRRNHETFKVRMIAQEERPDLLERFRIATTPTLLVVDKKVVKAKLVEPRGCGEIQAFLAPWLK